MKNTAHPERLDTLRRWTPKAALAGAVAFAGTFLVLSAFLCALFGLRQLQQPVVFGLFGPPLASELLRPGLVIAGAVAVVAVVIYGVGSLLGDNHGDTAPIILTDGPLDAGGLRDWPNVDFGDDAATSSPQTAAQQNADPRKRDRGEARE